VVVVVVDVDFRTGLCPNIVFGMRVLIDAGFPWDSMLVPFP
jgi:hypothetical protein